MQIDFSFKKTDEELAVEKIAKMPVVLNDKDNKIMAEIIKLPQELIFLNNLSKEENKRVMNVLKEYSDTIKFLYKRNKQAQEYYSDTKRQI